MKLVRKQFFFVLKVLVNFLLIKPLGNVLHDLDTKYAVDVKFLSRGQSFNLFLSLSGKFEFFFKNLLHTFHVLLNLVVQNSINYSRLAEGELPKHLKKFKFKSFVLLLKVLVNFLLFRPL